jgi:D-3-phosphoglycerate dehydrogenase / 2-oxoglutarate reductase
MKVLIADPFEPSGVEGLKAAGCEVLHQPELKDEALARAIAETQADVLVVRGTRVAEAALEAGRLALVVRAGAGYNTIDVAAAARRGIYVSNCPGKNAIAVAELTLALILALDRRVPDNVADLRAGRWNKQEYSRARGLYGQTLGLLGAGSIAREVIRRAAAFGLHVVLWSRRFDGQDRPLARQEAQALGLDPAAAVALAPSPAEVAGRCDILSVHLALGPQTRGLVDAALLARLKPGAMLINTARGEVVDHQALAAAVRDRGLRAGLDVFASEPPTATGEMHDPIVGLPGVYGTHHIGASTEQAQEAIAAETVRIVRTYAETGEVPNVVNLSRKTPASHMLVVRHRDRPGVLAHVFEHLREENVNIQETENVVFEGAEAAVARVNLDHAPTPALLAAIRDGNADVLDLRLIAL